MKIPFASNDLRAIADALDSVNEQLGRSTFYEGTPGVSLDAKISVTLNGDSKPAGTFEWFDDWIGFWPAGYKEEK
jgi:hypothetical protein